MGRIRVALAIAAVGSVAAFGAIGCGGDGDDTGTTPPATETTVQTTDTGAVTDTGATDTGATDTEAAEGDVAAGKTFFEGACQACHPAGGNEVGAGPKLAGIGWSADQIKNQIEKPVGTMPPNLASGEDLDNVVAYVVSLQ